MPSFAYTAMIDGGALRTGELMAASQDAVVQYLEGRGEYAIKVVENHKRRSLHRLQLGRRGPSQTQVTLFTRQLAWLLRAGVTLPRALGLLAEELRGTALGDVVEQISVAIRTGEPLSTALDRHPEEFHSEYCSMVRIAEMSGTLESILAQMAESRERDQAVRRKLLSALIYPSILVTVAVAAVLFILCAVVPKIKDMLVGPHVKIPYSTERLIALSDWLIGDGWFLACGAVLLGAGVWLASRHLPMRRRMGNLWLRLPLVGATLRLGLTVRFARTLATLLTAGVGLPAAFDLLRRAAETRELSAVTTAVGTALRKGEDFLAPISTSWLFPKLFTRVLRIGEETGSLGPSLNQIASIFEDQLNVRVERALTILEPVIILCLSVVVGLIIASVMDGIISVNDLAI